MAMIRFSVSPSFDPFYDDNNARAIRLVITIILAFISQCTSHADTRRGMLSSRAEVE